MNDTVKKKNAQAIITELAAIVGWMPSPKNIFSPELKQPLPKAIMPDSDSDTDSDSDADSISMDYSSLHYNWKKTRPIAWDIPKDQATPTSAPPSPESIRHRKRSIKRALDRHFKSAPQPIPIGFNRFKSKSLNTKIR
ncbi:MAG: hypothetical protein ACJA1M_001521 [Alphaproteobacteria bacterium]|jgi:hypothetical protein